MSQTRDKILSAARHLFEEKGFDSTTVREIALQASVNIALISYHFGSKQQLLSALIEDMAARTNIKLADINKSSVDAGEKLYQAVEIMVDKIVDNKKYYQMIHRELSMTQRPELNQEISKVLKKNRAEIVKIIEEGQRKRLFRKDIDMDLTVGTIFGLIHQITHAGFKDKINASGNDEDLKKRVKDHLWEILKRFLKRN